MYKILSTHRLVYSQDGLLQCLPVSPGTRQKWLCTHASQQHPGLLVQRTKFYVYALLSHRMNRVYSYLPHHRQSSDTSAQHRSCTTLILVCPTHDPTCCVGLCVNQNVTHRSIPQGRNKPASDLGLVFIHPSTSNINIVLSILG